jgi:hypothetical protein
LLEFIRKSVNEIILPREVGILPFKLLLFTKNETTLVNLPISDGIDPLNSFEYRRILVNDNIFPIDVGMVPDTTLEVIVMDIAFKLPSHVTPVHGVEHTGVAGDPPIHLQPVKSVLVSRFEDATKSHKARSDIDTVGIIDGNVLGTLLGIVDGLIDGKVLGIYDGKQEGDSEGGVVGLMLGIKLGILLGFDVGRAHSL